MSSLSEFASQAAPFFLIALWGFAAISISVWVTRRYMRLPVSYRFPVGLMIFLCMLLLPASDEIAGRVYLQHLCATEAGIKVYQPADISAAYWDEKGVPTFIKENGGLEDAFIEQGYRTQTQWQPVASGVGVERYRQMLFNPSHEVMGEVVTYIFQGGWITRTATPRSAGVDCRGLHDKDFWYRFYGLVFKPATAS